jgi:hypothetical protein
VPHEPPRRTPRKPPTRESARPDRDAEDDDHEGDTTSDRPTVNPPFDVEAFARASASSVVPTQRGPMFPQAHDSSNLPTARPPPIETPARPQQITLTDEIEIDKALNSLQRPESQRSDTMPRSESQRSDAIQRSDAPSALSMANARASSSANVPAAKAAPPTSIEAAVLGIAEGSAGPEITERTIDPIAEMRERLSLGDYTGAFEMAELLLAEDPGDVEAAECAESCRSVLEGMYSARLGPLDRAPMLIVQRSQLRWLSMDHRAGFVLSLIDGLSTLEMILDVSGMPRLDAMRILQELLQQKIIALK